jgi:phenylacetate-CoA ligase
LELVEGADPVPDGQAGEILATGLLNPDMPLIRYRLGDRVSRSVGRSACPCGRTLPVLRSIEGRNDDVLYTADGRQVGRLDPVFKADMPIREAQIIQESLDRVRVRLVPAAGYSRSTADSVVERLRERLGPIRVDIEEVDEIPRASNGKFRTVLRNMPPP